MSDALKPLSWCNASRRTFCRIFAYTEGPIPACFTVLGQELGGHQSPCQKLSSMRTLNLSCKPLWDIEVLGPVEVFHRLSSESHHSTPLRDLCRINHSFWIYHTGDVLTQRPPVSLSKVPQCQGFWALTFNPCSAFAQAPQRFIPPNRRTSVWLRVQPQWILRIWPIPQFNLPNPQNGLHAWNLKGNLVFRDIQREGANGGVHIRKEGSFLT